MPPSDEGSQGDRASRPAVQTRPGLDPAAAARAFEEMIPLGRHATPEEIAQLALFLAGDESRFITGATIAVDGGMSI